MQLRWLMFFKRTLFVVLLFSLNLSAQVGISGKLKQNRTLLRQIENQINELRTKIATSKKQESSLLHKIALIDQEMALIQRSRGILQQEVQLLNQKIDSTRQALKETEERLQSLRDLYARRAVYAYKYGHKRNLELLLTSRSLNQALIRLKYLKQIASHDEKLMYLIQKKKEHIRAIKAQLEQNLAQKSAALNRIKQQEQIYLSRRKEKQRLLRRIKWTRKTYASQLNQREKEKQRLLDLIASLEKSRKTQTIPSPKEAPPDFKFQSLAKAKGKLPWPAKGKIITHYGRQRDPKTKTSIRRFDIEIKVKESTPVHCVFPGVVRMITYLPGYGNTVIVDHGKGYYTVYAHLSEIYVYKNSYVDKNQIIGKVGSAGYIGPVSLVFGIYGSNRTYNPEKWLE